MNTELLDRLDDEVAHKFGTKDFSSSIINSQTVLYFNAIGQPIVEFIIDGMYEDFSGLHISVRKFLYSNALGAGDLD